MGLDHKPGEDNQERRKGMGRPGTWGVLGMVRPRVRGHGATFPPATSLPFLPPPAPGLEAPPALV